MNTAGIFVAVALAAGGLRALRVWRSATKVEVVNVAALNLLARGRSEDVDALLTRAGPAEYLTVARAIVRSAVRLLAEDESGADETSAANGSDSRTRSAWEQLAHDAELAVVTAMLNS